MAVLVRVTFVGHVMAPFVSAALAVVPTEVAVTPGTLVKRNVPLMAVSIATDAVAVFSDPSFSETKAIVRSTCALPSSLCIVEFILV